MKQAGIPIPGWKIYMQMILVPLQKRCVVVCCESMFLYFLTQCSQLFSSNMLISTVDKCITLFKALYHCNFFGLKPLLIYFVSPYFQGHSGSASSLFGFSHFNYCFLHFHCNNGFSLIVKIWSVVDLLILNSTSCSRNIFSS